MEEMDRGFMENIEQLEIINWWTTAKDKPSVAYHSPELPAITLYIVYLWRGNHCNLHLKRVEHKQELWNIFLKIK